MQTLNIKPLEIIIAGQYYDSQIYDGKLYLWKIDGSILVLNWNKLIDNIDLNVDLDSVLRFALQFGDDLYNNILFQDREIRDLIFQKFKRLVEKPIEISSDILRKFTISEQDNPLPFPHADSSIHYKTVYVGSQSGVSSTKSNFSIKKSLNPEAEKLCDIPILSLSASHSTLALAAGSEGLFDYYVGENLSRKRNEPRLIIEQHSNFVRWLYPSFFSSSYFNEGFFADFEDTKKRRTRIRQTSQNGQAIQIQLANVSETTIENESPNTSLERNKIQSTTRKFNKLISANEIFKKEEDNEPILTWGTHDKICLITESSIQLVKCYPTSKKEEEKFIDLGSIKSQELLGDIVSGDSSFFGIVLEKEDGLLIITSLGDYIKIPGEPVNWRVFPRSKNYTNQLHVVYEDCIRVYSFNHDFFVDQNSKKIGISFGSN